MCPVCRGRLDSLRSTVERLATSIAIARDDVRDLRADRETVNRRLDELARRADLTDRMERGHSSLVEVVVGLRAAVDDQARALAQVRATVGMRLQEAVRATWRAWLQVLA